MGYVLGLVGIFYMVNSWGDALQRGQQLADNLRESFFTEYAKFFLDATDIAMRYSQNEQDSSNAVLAPFQGHQTLGEQINQNGTLNRLFTIFAQCKTSRTTFKDSNSGSLFIEANWQAHSVFPNSVGILNRFTEAALAISETAETLPEGTKKDDFNAIKHSVLVGCHLIATDLSRELNWIYKNRPTSEEDSYGGCDSKEYDDYLQRLLEKNTLPETGGGRSEVRVPSVAQRLASYDQIPQLLGTLKELNEKILAQGLSSTWPSPLQSQGRT